MSEPGMTKKQKEMYKQMADDWGKHITHRTRTGAFNSDDTESTAYIFINTCVDCDELIGLTIIPKVTLAKIEEELKNKRTFSATFYN